MKANELMIGDWYAFRGLPYKCTASVIASIAECEKKGVPTDISEIPLTPEILEKNGFQYGNTPDEEDFASVVSGVLPEKCWWYNEGVCEIRIIFPKGADGGLVSMNDGHNDRLMEFVFTDLAVHELQHLLRSCKIDKEINL